MVDPNEGAAAHALRIPLRRIVRHDDNDDDDLFPNVPRKKRSAYRAIDCASDDDLGRASLTFPPDVYEAPERTANPAGKPVNAMRQLVRILTKVLPHAELQAPRDQGPGWNNISEKEICLWLWAVLGRDAPYPAWGVPAVPGDVYPGWSVYLSELLSWATERAVTCGEAARCLVYARRQWHVNEEQLRRLGAYTWNWTMPLERQQIRSASADRPPRQRAAEASSDVEVDVSPAVERRRMEGSDALARAVRGRCNAPPYVRLRLPFDPFVADLPPPTTAGHPLPVRTLPLQMQQRFRVPQEQRPLLPPPPPPFVLLRPPWQQWPLPPPFVLCHPSWLMPPPDASVR